MAGSAWDAMSETAREYLEPYPNIAAFLQAMPERENDVAGQRLTDALTAEISLGEVSVPVGIDQGFAARLDSALADPALRQEVAALPADTLAANVNRVIESPESLPQILAEVRAGQAAETGAAVTPPPQPPEPALEENATLELSPEAAAPEPAAGGGLQGILLALAGSAQDPETAQMLRDIAGAEGIDGLSARIENSPELQNLVEGEITRLSAQGIEPGGENFFTQLHAKLQEEPGFINEVNQMIDQTPPQLLNTMIQSASSDPNLDLFAQLERGVDMANNPMMQNLMDSPFGQTLATVFEHLMEIIGPLLAGLGNFANSLTDAMQGISRGPTYVAASDGDARLARGLGANPAEVTGPDGQPVPEQAPAPVPEQDPARTAVPGTEHRPNDPSPT